MIQTDGENSVSIMHCAFRLGLSASACLTAAAHIPGRAQGWKTTRTKEPGETWLSNAQQHET